MACRQGPIQDVFLLRQLTCQVGVRETNMTTGWWFQPLWKILFSQLGLLFPIYRKIKNVPNHQAD